MSIALRDKFDSWQQKEKLDAYCNETYQNYQRTTARWCNLSHLSSIQFAFMRLSCVHYGLC